jgi:hypothetical protein
METFIVIARYWSDNAIIGVFPSRDAAQEAIAEVQTWEDDGGPVYGGWSFYIHRTELGSLMVEHPGED